MIIGLTKRDNHLAFVDIHLLHGGRGELTALLTGRLD